MSGALLLLVEDNPDEALLARRALRGCSVTADLVVAASGEEALALLQEDPYGGLPDAPKPVLVLLDLKLPGIDGIEVLRRIRADERTRTLPVVVLSSSRARRDVTSCYEVGANGFVQKAVDFDQFLESMKALTSYWLRVNVAPTHLL